MISILLMNGFAIQLRDGFILAQPVVSQVNAIAALWGKQFGQKERVRFPPDFPTFRLLQFGAPPRKRSDRSSLPYRSTGSSRGRLDLLQASHIGRQNGYLCRTVRKRRSFRSQPFGLHVARRRDYNLGSGYSTKAGAGIIYNKRLAFLLNMENYHIFTWKGYDPEIDWSQTDPSTLNIRAMPETLA